MALVESLLSAIMRADGDALVMHVGEKPYVVAPAGPIELSTHGLNLQAMAGMVAQLLPAEMQRALTEFGAVEHELPPLPALHNDRFTVVVARGGEDVWIEIRRDRRARPVAVAAAAPAAAASVVEAPPVEAPAEGPDPVDAPTLAEAPSPVEEAGPAEATGLVEAPSHAEEVGPAEASAPLEEAHPVEAAHVDAPSEPVEVAAPPPLAEEPAELETVPVAQDDVPAVALPEVLVAEAPHVELAVTEEQAPAVETPAANDPATSVAPAMEPIVETEPALQPAAMTEVEPSLPALQIAPEPQVVLESEAVPEPVIESPPSEPEPVIPAPEPSTASVIPMTRTLRIEVPQTVATRRPAGPSEIERLLGIAAARGATALYLTTQASPFLRVDDDVRMFPGEPPLTSTDVESAVLQLMPEATREALRRGGPTEWESELEDIGRIRCSTFSDYRGLGAIFQLVSVRPQSAEQLGLSPEIQALASETEGLVLVASPRGHGKTTLIGAFVDLINRQRPGYVITLERQIRFVHEHHRALISQREVRGTADQELAAARGAMREQPDVVVIDDLPSADVFQLALDAAGSGRLVFASVTAPSTTAALTRIVELFPADRRKGIQSLLAERMRGAIAQVLPRKGGGGRAAAREFVLATSAVARVLADGQLQDLPMAIESGRKHGLISLTDSLVQFVRSGVIDVREAYRKADDRDALLLALKRENVDMSVVERLA